MGMQQATPPQLASTAGDWMASLLLETLTLVQPLTAGGGSEGSLTSHATVKAAAAFTRRLFQRRLSTPNV